MVCCCHLVRFVVTNRGSWSPTWERGSRLSWLTTSACHRGCTSRCHETSSLRSTFSFSRCHRGKRPTWKLKVNLWKTIFLYDLVVCVFFPHIHVVACFVILPGVTAAKKKKVTSRWESYELGKNTPKSSSGSHSNKYMAGVIATETHE